MRMRLDPFIVCLICSLLLHQCVTLPYHDLDLYTCNYATEARRPFLAKLESYTPETRPMLPKASSNPEKTGQLVSVEGAMNLEAYLQQPVEDGIIMKYLVTLRIHIESHTMDFYHRDVVPVNGAELGKNIEERILTNTTEDAAALASILLEPRSRATGIRCVIARILFASIDFFGDPQQTLLSPTAVSLMSSFRSKKNSDESQESETNATTLDELQAYARKPVSLR